jgi:hypothetical protein
MQEYSVRRLALVLKNLCALLIFVSKKITTADPNPDPRGKLDGDTKHCLESAIV